jgi:FkbM family methyltransferase
MYSFHPGLEKTILELCGNIKDGYFVDIGAHDGIDGNNTKFLEDLGWRGICIEPHPLVFEKLKVNRNCECSNAAVWEKNTRVNFLALSGYPEMLSGIVECYDPRHLARIQRELINPGGTAQFVEIEALTFDTLVKEKKINFLSIDTEGSELNILSKVNFDEYDIRVICIENNFRDPSFQEFFEKRGYKYHSTFLVCDQVYYK